MVVIYIYKNAQVLPTPLPQTKLTDPLATTHKLLSRFPLPNSPKYIYVYVYVNVSAGDGAADDARSRRNVQPQLQPESGPPDGRQTVDREGPCC